LIGSGHTTITPEKIDYFFGEGVAFGAAAFGAAAFVLTTFAFADADDVLEFVAVFAA